MSAVADSTTSPSSLPKTVVHFWVQVAVFFGYGFKWYLRPAITIATLYYINIINQQIRLILGGYPSLKLFKVNAVQWIWTDVELPSWALSFALSFWLTSRPEVCTACGVWLGYRFPMVSYGRNRISPAEVPVLATKKLWEKLRFETGKHRVDCSSTSLLLLVLTPDLFRYRCKQSGLIIVKITPDNSWFGS